MKVLLLNIDSKLPNLALKKIEMWHKEHGDEISWDMPIMLKSVDKAYASCIFTNNKAKVLNYLGLNPNLIIGGTSFDLTVKLPIEIESMKPKINYGFTTRGCIRKCPFCVVPKSEGYINIVGDIYDIWNGKDNSITLLDNNILAIPNHFKMICQQLLKEKITVDFNQALDIRLVNQDIALLLSKLRYKRQISFSFDYMNIETEFRRGMAYIQEAGIRMSKIMVFLLVGFNTNLQEDLERIEIVKSYGASPFVMKYQQIDKIEPIIKRDKNELKELARWINQPHGFYKVMTFLEFLQTSSRNEKYCDIITKRHSQSVMRLEV